MVCRTWSQGRASQVHIGVIAWLASWGMFPAHKKVSGNSLSCSEEPAHGTSGSTRAAGKEDKVKGHLLDVLDSLNNFHAAAQVGMPVLEFRMRPAQMLSGVSERKDNQKKAGPGTNSFLPQHCSVTPCQSFTFSEGTSSYGVDHFIVNSAQLSGNQGDLREFDGSPV